MIVNFTPRRAILAGKSGLSRCPAVESRDIPERTTRHSQCTVVSEVGMHFTSRGRSERPAYLVFLFYLLGELVHVTGHLDVVPRK
jgi:hypothetical protein